MIPNSKPILEIKFLSKVFVLTLFFWTRYDLSVKFQTNGSLKISSVPVAIIDCNVIMVSYPHPYW